MWGLFTCNPLVKIPVFAGNFARVNFTVYIPTEHFIRHCRQHFVKFSFWRSLIETAATKKKLFRTFYLFDFWFQLFEFSFAHEKTWLKRQFIFWESGIWRMQFLLDLCFWHSVEEAWTRFFPTQNWFICIREKDWKNHTIWRRKLDHYFHSNMFHFGFHFISIYFCFIFFWSGQVEAQKKRTQE